MYLKELEIVGFKSFPQKTNLKFEPGITVVVGPNGCGKSNILDAIKWALGEQSPKSLRGSKMEDVIFNGTENYSSLNYAEVILNFFNEDRYLPIDYKEVSVSRKLYRSGESQYFINKNLVRLKDVQDLFMGTGLGESTYSFIEQGEIDIFLSYKPEEKRLIFDEASGISKFKERKKETLKRLEDTEENLLRVEDIILEVKRQLKCLQRQVDKAREFKEIQSELIVIEKKIATYQFRDLEEKTNKSLEELGGLKEKEQRKDKELRQIREDNEKLGSQLTISRKRLEEVNSQIISLSARLESSQNYIVIYNQMIKELEQQKVNFAQSTESLRQSLSLTERRMEDEKERLGVIEESLAECDREIKTRQEEKEDLQRKLGEIEKKTEEAKGKILEFESNRVNVTNQLIEIQTNLSSLMRRKSRLFLDKAKLGEFLSEKRKGLRVVQEELEKMESNLNKLREKKSSLVLRQKEFVFQREDLRNRLMDREKELVELNACYEFLKELRIKDEIFSLKKRVTVIFDEEPKNINKLLVTLKGVEFLKEGNSYKANIEAKVVSLEEAQLEEKINFIKEEKELIKINLEQLEKLREELTKEVNLEEGQINEEEIKYQRKLGEKENLSQEEVRIGEEFKLLDDEIKTLLREIGDLEEKQKRLEQEKEFYEESLNKAKESLAGYEEVITKDSQRIKEIDSFLVDRVTQKQSFYKEKEGLDSRFSLLEEQKDNILKELEKIEREKEEIVLRTISYTEEIKKLNLKIEEDKDKIKEYSWQKQELEKEENSLVKTMEEKKSLEQLLEKEVGDLSSLVYNKKLEIQGLEYEKVKIKDYLYQVYQVEFEPKFYQEIPESYDNLHIEKEKIKRKISSLGEVSLAAEEEFKELKEREDFLESQKQDLIVSKEDLKKAIGKINRTSKELFLETFEKIAEEFKSNFRFLFGGGRAQLILLDRDNILESGVEIEVQPPGKKLQNIALLSGGEKALAAIALIFAIFKVKPSPLCVLDEIDAPLDEANVDRFNHLLKEFSQSSQFILITHNKKTMSKATCLYGVTMEEKGVSKLVSVKFASEKVPA